MSESLKQARENLKKEAKALKKKIENIEKNKRDTLAREEKESRKAKRELEKKYGDLAHLPEDERNAELAARKVKEIFDKEERAAELAARRVREIVDREGRKAERAAKKQVKAERRKENKEENRGIVRRFVKTATITALLGAALGGYASYRTPNKENKDDDNVKNAKVLSMDTPPENALNPTAREDSFYANVSAEEKNETVAFTSAPKKESIWNKIFSSDDGNSLKGSQIFGAKMAFSDNIEQTFAGQKIPRETMEQINKICKKGNVNTGNVSQCIVLCDKNDDVMYFSVSYKKLVVKSRKANNKIVADTKKFNDEWFRYTDRNGYTSFYDKDGNDLNYELNQKPVEEKNESNITSGYGDRKHPVLEGLRKHRGVDYSGRKNSNIYACGKGEVIYSKASGRKSYGNLVIVKHGNNIVTAYGHLNTLNVKVGDKVDGNTVIGGMGTTGMSTGVHLHLEFGKIADDVNIDSKNAYKVFTNKRKYVTYNFLENHTYTKKIDGKEMDAFHNQLAVISEGVKTSDSPDVKIAQNIQIGRSTGR